MFIYGATTFTVSLLRVGYVKVTGQPLLFTRTGMLYLTFARVSVSLGSPTIRVMGILIAGILGILILQGPITWRYVLGLILTIAGVALIVLHWSVLKSDTFLVLR